jgi:hypothetical protein
MHYKKNYIKTVLILIIFLSACVSQNKTVNSKFNQLVYSNCNKHSFQKYTLSELPKPLKTTEVDVLLIDKFSFEALNTANAINVFDLLKELVEIKALCKIQNSYENRLRLLELVQKLNFKIHLSTLEISAVAGEMDCEEERADQIAVYLKEKEDNLETKLTAGAIVIGATGAISAGTILAAGNTTNLPEFIGIFSGFTETVLGTLIYLNKQSVNFYHERNALKEIWEGPEISDIFPPSIWYYLNYKSHNEKSIREQIKERWLSYGQIADKKNHINPVFFNKGGKYNANELVNRANMYDQIESYINLMLQDIKVLSYEIQQVYLAD